MFIIRSFHKFAAALVRWFDLEPAASPTDSGDGRAGHSRDGQHAQAGILSPSRFLLAIVLISLLLTSWQAVLAFHLHMFRGDEGARILGASFPVVKMGNRVWLPFLQTNIWILYLLRVPYLAYRIIPVAYFFLSLFFLALLSWKMLGRSRSTLWFLALLLAAFAGQEVVSSAGHRLMQEITGMALLYLLLVCGALELRGKRGIVLVAMAAMLARDSFWIYLFVFSILNWRSMVADRKLRKAVLIVWAAPVCWLLSLPLLIRVIFHRFPAFPLEWPLMINKDSGQVISRFSEGGGSLWTAFVNGKTAFPIAAFIVAVVLLWLAPKAPSVADRLSTFSARFVPFSLLSLAIIYAAILAFNPWEVTPGADRMMAPLVAQIFVWAVLLFGWLRALPGVKRILAQSVLCACLLLSVSTDPGRWRIPHEEKTAAAYSDILATLEDTDLYPGGKTCFIYDDLWDELERLAAPTIYNRHVFIGRSEFPYPADCDYLYLRAPVTEKLGADYRRAGLYEIEGMRYALYARRQR